MSAIQLPDQSKLYSYLKLLYRAMKGARASCKVSSPEIAILLTPSIDEPIPDAMNSKPDDIKAYLEKIRMPIILARNACYSTNEEAYTLLEAIHNVPDLLCRWPDVNEEWIINDLISHENRFCAGLRKYTAYISDNPSESDMHC